MADDPPNPADARLGAMAAVRSAQLRSAGVAALWTPVGSALVLCCMRRGPGPGGEPAPLMEEF